jgi:Protein of unknown function (DUF3306)
MTKPDSFILRWARLKRESGIEQKSDTSRNGSAIEPAEAASVRLKATAAQPRIDLRVDEPFDASSLPSIEAITANTDVRGFLESRVPAELTRAALRQAWRCDPAIRDFIGIAENQWDFNDPNAIPGFGPLEGISNEPAILTQVLPKDGVFEMFSDPLASEGLAPSFATGPTPSAVHEAAQQKVAELPSAGAGISCSSSKKRETGSKADLAAALENHDRSQNRRYHGSAMPH